MLTILSLEPEICNKLKVTPLVAQQRIKESFEFLLVRLYAEREVSLVEMDLEQRQSMVEQFDQMIGLIKEIKERLYIKFEHNEEQNEQA